MSKQANRVPPALRHGVYSGMALLPGEDLAAFEKFRRDIITEYKPNGRSEIDIVTNMADLMWRRQNLLIYRGRTCQKKTFQYLSQIESSL